MKHAKLILPVIVFSQFCCTSLWFAGNGVINDLVSNFDLKPSALGHLTSAVQFGFIIGTLVFALLTISDRFSPSKVFFFSALIGALFNLGVTWDGNELLSLIFLRFFTGFFLAGIYPVGMKIAADYYEKGLGKSLGFLVGALVMGTAFPHLLKEMNGAYPWKAVLVATSGLSLLGGLLMLVLVPNGPFRKAGQPAKITAFIKIFENRKFRSVAFGYFGHMWELYTFWAFVPVILLKFNAEHLGSTYNVPMLSFLIIGVGGLACVFSGFLASSIGVKNLAFFFLLLSGLCCLFSPVFLSSNNELLFVGFLFFWGIVVIADSPLLSTLVAQHAPADIKGTALTLVNSIGYTISIISIQLVTGMMAFTDSNAIFLVLAIGPCLGFIGLLKSKKQLLHPF
ncbi:MFS transporter [Cyclobacterium sediminis]